MESGVLGRTTVAVGLGAATILLSTPDAARPQAVAKAAEVTSPTRGGFLLEEARKEELSRSMREEGRRLEDEFRWEEAAPLYERAALLSSPEDPSSFEIFEDAGRCYFFSDRPREASLMWEGAAERAELHDRVFGAAQNYLKSALAAEESHDTERSSLNGLKALALSESPMLTDAERAWLEERLSLRNVVVGGERQ